MGPGVEAFLVYAVAALLSCAVSFVLGRHWPSPRQLDDAYDEGRGDGIAEMRDLLAADLDRSAVDAGDRRALPSAVPAGPPGAGMVELDAPRPGSAPSSGTGPGRLPSQDTYRAELARISRPDPAPWYAALVAPDLPVQPGPPAEPAWLERLLYKGAMSTAWCETFNSREMEVFHAHVDEWDRFIAAWAQEARWVTVGCRAWPPPGLVPA